MRPEVVADFACVTGECPLWHPDEQKLYWLDIPNGRLFRYDPITKNSELCYQGPSTSGFTIQADGSLLLFESSGAIRIWNEGNTILIREAPADGSLIFNDVIADPMGRVFVGAKECEECMGGIYRLDTGGSLTKVLDDYILTNGFAFSLNRKHIFTTDSLKHKHYIYDYNSGTGEITNQRVFIELPNNPEIVPDGMTIDSEGYIWSAHWGGACLVRYNPDGTEERRIDFPIQKTSSVTFGGKDYTDIFITTAGGDNKEKEGSEAGALFHINLGIQGVPEFFSRVGL